MVISYKWKVMVVGAMGVLLSTMDLGMMRIALPPLGEAFEVGPNSIIWVQLITFMVGTGMTLSIGKAADIYGRKMVFFLSLLIMSVGLCLCSLSQNFGHLLASRFILSIGLVVSLATAIAIVTAAFSTQERGKALGIIGAVSSMGLLSGPAIAGILIDTIGWRSIFYLRLPFSILAMLLAFFVLKRDPLPERTGRFDIAGAGLLLVAIPALLFVLNRGQHIGWSSPPVIMLTICGLALLSLFIMVERKAAQPVLEIQMFSSRFFSTISGSHLLFYISTTAVDFTMPFYLVQSISLSTAEAGLLLVTIPAMSMIVSPLSGRLSDRWGTRLLCGIGLALIALGILLLRRLTFNSSVAEIMLSLVLVGLGMALFVVPNTSAIMGAVSHEKLGSAAAMVNLLRQLGMSTGLAIAGSFFASSSLSHSTKLLSKGVAENIAMKMSVTEGMHYALLIALIFLMLGFIISTLRGRDTQLPDS
jgi:EmrB/QacA subfamily drug resistance transporter